MYREDGIMITKEKEPAAGSPACGKRTAVKIGMFNGKYTIPDDIDDCNDMITEMMEKPI